MSIIFYYKQLNNEYFQLCTNESYFDKTSQNICEWEYFYLSKAMSSIKTSTTIQPPDTHSKILTVIAIYGFINYPANRNLG